MHQNYLSVYAKLDSTDRAMVGASAPRDDGQDPRACERLRKLVRDCLAKNMNKGAIFFAGKLCSMSKYRADDVFLLAQVSIPMLTLIS